jgi:Ser/Thr protein kinase RdoA (MazF antagonist)
MAVARMLLADLQSALDHFVYDRIERSEDILFGVANYAYLLSTNSGNQYVLRQLVVQSPASVNANAHVQEILNSAGLVTPQFMYAHDGNAYAQVGENVVTVSRFIKGEMPTRITQTFVRSIGSTIAQFHHALKGRVVDIPENETQWLDPRNAKKEMQFLPHELSELLTSVLNESEAELAQVMLGLKKGVIHGDVQETNVFVRDEEVCALLDLETIQSNMPLIYDLARTYLILAVDSSEDNAVKSRVRGWLLDGYESHGSSILTEADYDAFDAAVLYVAAATTAWLYNHDARYRLRPYLRSAGVDLSTLNLV